MRLQFAVCAKDDDDDDDSDESFTDFNTSHAHLLAFENVINTNWNGGPSLFAKLP